MTTMYGISNCDTIKRARRWMARHFVDYGFHDFRRDGIDREMLMPWVEDFGWKALPNRRGLTWRRLDPERRESLDQESMVALLIEQPVIIRRPMLELDDGRRHIGFSEPEYASLFGVDASTDV